MFVLDGDNLRHGPCRDLGVTENDRTENVRRTAPVPRIDARVDEPGQGAYPRPRRVTGPGSPVASSTRTRRALPIEI